MEILKLIHKTREVTSEQLKDFYHCNDEQLVEKLIDFLERETNPFPFYATEYKPKYLHNTLLRIQHIYQTLQDEGNIHLPYHQRFLKVKQEKSKTKYVELVSKLDAISPLKTLTRGYSIIEQNSKIVKSVKQLNSGEEIKIKLVDGTKEAKII